MDGKKVFETNSNKVLMLDLEYLLEGIYFMMGINDVNEVMKKLSRNAKQ